MSPDLVARIAATEREVAKPRPLHAVPSPMRRCLVHDQSFERVCSGCRADSIAAEVAG